MENTIRFENITGQNTIPALCEENSVQLRKPDHKAGEYFKAYQLVSLVKCTIQSEIWYCLDSQEDGYILKITSQKPDMNVINTIQGIDCENLVPLKDCGESGKYWFEVYPYYKEGSIIGKVDQDTIRNVVLPGIIEGLNALHNGKIIHNDIKPSNLFWDDERTKVMIGDYGSATAPKEKPRHLTPGFAAPELLYNDTSSRASDWCSVGLTLASIVNGRPLIEAETVQQARKKWERGIRFREDGNIDQNLKLLINGMINMEVRKRVGPKTAAKWCKGGVFGGEARTRSEKTTIGQGTATISFQNPPLIATNIEGLIQGIANHWDYSLFLFRQRKLDKFLGEQNAGLIRTCKELRKLANDEDAMYRLTLEMDQCNSFVWRGRQYHSLIEMEQTWKDSEQGRKDITVFLQRGNVTFYIKKNGGDSEQTAFAERLRAISRIHPNEACAQLFQALKGNDGLVWDGMTLKSLDDLVDWLDTRKADMDQAVEEVFESNEFEAWLAYQGMGDVLQDIRRKCEI